MEQWNGTELTIAEMSSWSVNLGLVFDGTVERNTTQKSSNHYLFCKFRGQFFDRTLEQNKTLNSSNLFLSKEYGAGFLLEQ